MTNKPSLHCLAILSLFAVILLYAELQKFDFSAEKLVKM